MNEEHLNVLWGDNIVGTLTRGTRGKKGRVCFQYSPEWLKKRNLPISLSLPCSPEPYSADDSMKFFGNLVPEGIVYDQLCKKWRISPDDIYSFLSVFGEECAGALTIVKPDSSSQVPAVAYKDITDDLERILQEAAEYRTGMILESGARLSLAGAQDKLPVYTENGRYFIPESGSLAPTTDILKPAPPGFADLDINEAFCLRLAARIGLPVANASLVSFNSQRALLVERYDRTRTQGGVKRLHQEDFCQALRYKEKYEEAGGPGFAACAKILLIPAMGREADSRARDIFLRCAIFNYVAGNCDAHGKNFSLLYAPEGKISLAPFYDLVSTRAYPKLDQKFAMAIGKTFRFDKVAGHSWRELASAMHIRADKLREILTETVRQITAQASAVASEQEKAYGSSPIYEKILHVIEEGQARVEKAIEALQHPPSQEEESGSGLTLSDAP